MLTEFSGVVRKIVVSRGDWHVATIGKRSCAGEMPRLSKGQSVLVSGEEGEFRGAPQFKVSKFKVLKSNRDRVLEKWIVRLSKESETIPGVGPKAAERIIAHVRGDAIVDDIDRSATSARLREACRTEGLTSADMLLLRAGIRESLDSNREALKLHTWGLSSEQARVALKRFTPAEIEEDPFLLMSLPGISFATADSVYLASIKHELPDQSKRAAYASKILDEEIESEGHTRYPVEEYKSRLAKMLKVTSLPKQIFLYGAGSEFVQSAQVSNREESILSRIKQLNVQAGDKTGDLVSRALSCGICVIHGGPGTGKTTLIEKIAERQRQISVSIAFPALLAPTGRAASRLSEATGFPATTIHKFFGFNGRHLTEDRDPELIVIDEASMVDLRLFEEVLRRAPSSRIILVGDENQLPSIGPGQVLSDLLKSGRVPAFHLTKIHRQASDSPIVAAAAAVREGRVPEDRGVGSDFRVWNPLGEISARQIMCQVIYQLKTKRGFRVQVLSPMRSKGLLSTTSLDPLVASILNPEGRYGNQASCKLAGLQVAKGDKVMCIKNEYKKYNIMNGEMFYILRIGPFVDVQSADVQSGVISIERKDFSRLFESAWCVTVHKSQGSEWDAVLIVLSDQHKYLLREKALIYTAITRARKYCGIISSPGALRAAVSGFGSARHTGLADLLTDRMQERV